MIYIKSNDIKGKKLADSVSAVGSMLLFLMFLIFSLIIISCTTNAYSRISNNFDEVFSSSAAVRYISNKLRSGTGAQLYEDGKAIIIDCGSLSCMIYADSDGVYEKYTDKDALPIFAGGEMIFSNTDINIVSDDNLYFITAESGEDFFSAYCRI